MRNKNVILAALTLGVVILASGCGEKENATTYDNTKTESTKTSGNTDSANEKKTSGEITEEEAKKIALENAKVQESEVGAIQIQKEIDDGISLYNVEFYAGAKEYDYEISATDGSILSADYDAENEFNNQKNGINPTGNARISEEDAKKAVLERVEGATEENIRMNLEVDDGIQVYEGSVVYQDIKYEFEMNAENGEMISWEQESIYD